LKHHPAWIRRECGGQNFERYVALQPSVPRAIYFAHSPRAEQGVNSIGSQLVSRRELPGTRDDLGCNAGHRPVDRTVQVILREQTLHPIAQFRIGTIKQ
jgi:hypothetical protein